MENDRLEAEKLIKRLKDEQLKQLIVYLHAVINIDTPPTEK